MANDQIIYPLSFSQESLWFLHQLDPSIPAYNNVSLFRLTGPLDIFVLEKSLNEIIRRHETLRSIFPADNGIPRQVILPFEPRPLALIDYTGTPEDQSEYKASNFATAEKRQPIDLAIGPMIQASLLVFSSDLHFLVIHIHHMVTDAWSETLILKELAACYDSFSHGETPHLSELKMQFGEYARWQRGWMQGERLDKYLFYWKDKLAGAIPFLDLSTDFPRSRVQTFNGMCHSMILPQTLTSGLKAFCQRERCTQFMALLTAFKALLFRYTGQEDIIVGSPFANRFPKETENLIGYFVNTLPLRTSLGDDPSFRELVGRVRETVLDAFQFQALPFERIVEDLKIERDLNRTPIFQVVMNMLNVPPRPGSVGNLRIERIFYDHKVTPFDLMIDVRELDGELAISLTANTDLFDAVTIRRFSSHFTRLLDGALADPEARLSRLPLLNEEEHVRFNAGIRPQRSSPADKCIHELFEAQAEKTPEATALVFQDQKLSYRELNWRANLLAWRLRAEGVGPETLVGLCVERSPEMIIGILSILKAGGAYVPLDPDYPQERLAFILQDAAIPLVLVQQHLIQVLPESGTKLVCLEEGEGISSGGENLAPVTTPDNLAYIIYTSGSTGLPKGVMVTHENVVRLFQQTQSWFHFDGHDVWSLFHSYAFDFSVWEIWGALLFGGRLVIVPYQVSRTPEELYRLICREDITVLCQTPSFFYRLMEAEQALGRSPDLALETVIFGGEVLNFQRLRPWFEQHAEGRPRLVNMYGITETTVHVTYRPLQAADLSLAGSMIGRPIPDLTVYILDSNLQPVPPGVRGEMFVGGAGLARGYLNRPELSRERFLLNPFSDLPGDRLYRTGDMARVREDGDIEYLGRADDQVKIHGFRVELGEIEAAIMSHIGVRDAVVVLRRQQPEDQRLVAFYVPRQGAAPTADKLRQFLTGKLPDYMLPSNYMQLVAFPITSSGKIDRRALAGMEIEEHATQYVPPKDRFETTLVEIWQKVLGVERVGMTDNFFELGGHSLLAAELFAKIEKEFSCTLPLAALFEDGTVSYIAKLIKSVPAAQQKPLIIPMQLDKSKPPIFLAPGGGADVVYLFELAKQLGLYYSVYGFRSIMIENDRLLTIPEIAMRYIPEIRIIQPEGPYYFLGHSAGGMVVFEIAYQLREASEQVGLVGLLDTYAPGRRYEATWQERLLIHRRNILSMRNARELVAYLRARLQRLFFNKIRTTSFTNFAVRKRLIPRDRMTLSTLSQFNYNPLFLDGRLTVFRAADRPWYVRVDPLAGWKEYARQVDYIEITGSHMSHLSEPHVQELVRRLQAHLNALNKTS
jgi:amino acid adenylation domain-containing protein